MRLLFFYSFRNLFKRRLTTFLTVAGMGFVIFVFASMLMLAEGIQRTLIETGSSDNVVVIRRSSGSEVQSIVERPQASIVETQPEVALGPEGQRMVAKEMLVLVNLMKRGSMSPSNVAIRGIDRNSLLLRPQVRIKTGRMPYPGSSEIVAGESVAKRFKDVSVGESLTFAGRSWLIVGILDAGSTGFSSEIWADVDQLMQAFRRPVYSSVILHMGDPKGFTDMKKRIEGDPRLTLEAKRETDYYREQSEGMSKFLRIFGISFTLIFSIGAIIGAMITMYAAVANRTIEIGTLRALGFKRKNILSAFLMESLILGLLGGISGLFFASFLQFFTISTTNFQTFSELAFSFSLSTEIITGALGFALFMGLTGGILPAYRASRMNIVESLRMD